MDEKQPTLSLREHLSRASRIRWAKVDTEGRKKHAKMMSKARWLKKNTVISKEKK